MIINDLKNEILYEKNILKDYSSITNNLNTSIVWDNSIKSRKTASFGVPYNYSGLAYSKNEIPKFLDILLEIVFKKNGFHPNNCLINYYYEYNSKMGFHSDQIENLYSNTGIAIFSFGSPRIMRFKNKKNNIEIYDIILENNSYFFMTQTVQMDWLHSVLPSTEPQKNERYSITFRKIVEELQPI
jgi:alkylated DNA repair dioxygenase AlkB